MATNTAYRILLEAQIDTAFVTQQIKTISAKNTILLNAKFDPATMDKLTAQLDKIKASGAEISKITLFGGKDGKPAQAAIQYLDANRNIVKATIDINKGLITTHSTMQNLTRDANEFSKALLNADKFIARSKNMAQTPSVTTAVKTAEAIKVAVADGDIEKVRELNAQLAIQKSAISGVRTGLESWARGMSNAIKQTVEYSLSIGLVYGAINQFKQGIAYIKDLDKAMTDIRLVTGQSADDVGKLAMGYNNLAKEMGATTLEVAEGSLEFIRQGKSAEDTAILIRNSTMMSKLANMESTEATDRLTSIMNGFKLEAQETGTVIDKLVGLDNAYATSVNEIATAMKYGSNSAQQVGVDFDHLAAYITVVSSTTRMSAETIGQSMKTLFARMTDIKQGFDIGEGTDVNINNVEKSLRSAGVALRDSANDFRDMQDVLYDLGLVWDTLTEVEQNNIAKQVAGVRQKEQFLVLMEHQEEIQKALITETEAEGLALQRYALYMESVEAAQNRATASWEKLAQSTMNSGMVTGFYNSTSALLEFIDTIGGVPAVLAIATTALVIFNSASIASSVIAFDQVLGKLFFTTLPSFVAALNSGTAAQWLLNTAMLANPATLVVAGLAALVGVLALVAINSETASEKFERLNQEISNTNSEISKLRDKAQTIKNLSEEYEKLANSTSRTEEETQRLLDIQNILKDVMPELAGHFDEYGNFIIDASVDMDTLNTETLKQIEYQKQLRQIAMDEQGGILGDNLMEAKKALDSLKTGGATSRGTAAVQYTEKEKLQIELDWSLAITGAKNAFAQMSVEAQNAFIAELRQTSRGQEILDAMFGDSRDDFYEQLYTPKPSDIEEAQNAGKELAEKVYVTFSDTIKQLSETEDIISSLMDKSMKGELDLSDIAKMPPEYTEALSIQGDKIKLNIDLLKELQIEQARTALEATISAQEAGMATEQQVAIVQYAYDQLMLSAEETYSQFNLTAWQYDELLWQIANDAVSAGYTFEDMTGKALTSAEQIYAYMSQGDATFNDFISQAANATGVSVAQAMNTVAGMVAQTYNNTLAMIQSLGNSMAGIYAMQGFMASGGANYNPAPVSLFSTPAIPKSSGGGGGGGGGKSKADKKAEKDRQREAEARRKEQELKKQIDEAREGAIEGLEDQLDVYKDILDARKDILDTMLTERSYQQDIEEKNKNILNIQNELATLQFDTSAEAQARRLQLQDDLAKAQQELENTQLEHSVEKQKSALDADYEAFKAQIESAIKAVEGINASSLGDFASQLAVILSQMSSTANATGTTTPVKESTGGRIDIIKKFHDGGMVGNTTTLKSNETFAKLMNDELVVTSAQMQNFMETTLPAIVQGSSSGAGGIEINMPINVAGSLDKSVIPDLEKITNSVVKKINDAMNNRGYTRRAESYGI